MGLNKKIYDSSPKWAKFYWHALKKLVLWSSSSQYPIIKDPNDILDKVYKIKDDTWEDSYYPECYGHCKEQHLEVFSPCEYIFKERKAIVSVESDIVITSKGVYWDKFNNEEFITWAFPSDVNILSYDKDQIRIRHYKEKKYVPGLSLSLLGVWASHWGHCMYQFLPKLFSAGEAGFLNNKISILVPETEDSTIIEIITGYLANFPNAMILYAKKNTEYICEELLFMPTSGSNFNNPKFRLDYPYFISRHVLDKTKKYVIDPIIAQVKDNKPKFEKIYLSRKGKRTASNFDEINKFLLDQGFVEIEGSKLSLIEKADIFYHAKEIVGMYGSGFLNLMFCNNARAMCFINYKMSTDTSLYLQIRDYVSVFINVTGQDENSEYHTNTYYPVEKVKKVYTDYIKS